MAAAVSGAKSSGNSTMIVTLAILTLLGAGAGALVGKLVAGRLHAAPQTVAPSSAAAPLPYAGDTEVRELEPIITDLAGDNPVRVRLQLSIVFTRKAVEHPSMLAAQISDDILAFMRTLTLDQLQGASGLQNLREDLNERASVRSQGAVREVIIETLVTQ